MKISQSSVFSARPFPDPAAPSRAPALPPDLSCQRDKARDSGQSLEKGKRCRLLGVHFLGLPAPGPRCCISPPARPHLPVPPCCVPGEQPWSPETPRGEQAGCSGGSLFCSLRSRGLLQGAAGPGARVLRSSQKLLAWEGRGSSGMSLSTASSTRACRALASGQGCGSSGEKLTSIGCFLSRLRRARPPPRTAICLRLCGRLAPWSWSPCSSCCLPLGGPPPPGIPTAQQGPRGPLPQGGRTAVGAQCCRPRSGATGQLFSAASSLTAEGGDARGCGQRHASQAAPWLPGKSELFIWSGYRCGRLCRPWPQGVLSGAGLLRLPADRGRLQPKPGPPPCSPSPARQARPATPFSCLWSRNRLRGQAGSVCHRTSLGTECLLPECPRLHT